MWWEIKVSRESYGATHKTEVSPRNHVVNWGSVTGSDRKWILEDNQMRVKCRYESKKYRPVRSWRWYWKGRWVCMHYLERQKLSRNIFLILIKSLRCRRQTSGTQTQLFTRPDLPITGKLGLDTLFKSHCLHMKDLNTAGKCLRYCSLLSHPTGSESHQMSHIWALLRLSVLTVLWRSWGQLEGLDDPLVEILHLWLPDQKPPYNKDKGSLFYFFSPTHSVAIGSHKRQEPLVLTWWLFSVILMKSTGSVTEERKMTHSCYFSVIHTQSTTTIGEISICCC